MCNGVRQYQNHNSGSVTNYDFKLWIRVSGKHKISAQEILEVIFELNDSSASGTLRDTVSEIFLYDTTISESVMENTTYYMHYPTPNEEGKIFSTNEPYIAAEASSSG